MSAGRSRGTTRRIPVLVAASVMAGLSGIVLPGPPAAIAASCAASADSPVIEAASSAQQRMGAARAWPRTTGDVVVAVLDTGVSAASASLQGHVLPGTDLAGGAADTDCYGRGTFIGSLIAGHAREGTEFVGLAPGATILPVRITNNPDDFSLTAALPGRLAEGITAAVAGGARVVAIPLTATTSSPELEQAVRAAVAADVLIVAAAGTSGTGEAAYPASLEGVLSVAPFDDKGGRDASRLGAVPDIAAPSSGLVGAVPDGAGHVVGDEPSLAVAYAAGAAALVRDDDPTLTVAAVIQRLEATADAPTRPVPNGATIDPSLGAGVVDPVAAVSRLAPELRVSPSDEVPRLEISPPVDHRPGDLALMSIGGLLAAAAAVLGPLVGVVTVRRRTADRAASREGPALPAEAGQPSPRRPRTG
ncbi:S8 family serine peptidase [uncultured Microbacterium sp.]|uniref:S8 family serine peptidase n=1 Tax=uncultured Microbacterium sp. TaxID=191216 RepID=UPI0025D129BA|nr:S8 family serine peptidase [uncultured Microbacterium sp.]